MQTYRLRNKIVVYAELIEFKQRICYTLAKGEKDAFHSAKSAAYFIEYLFFK